MADQRTEETRRAPTPTAARTTDGQASYNELVERLRSIEGINDNVAETLAKNWQRIVGAVVIIFIGVWLVQKYRQSQQEKVGEAAQSFAEASQSYAIFAGSTADNAAADKDWAFQPKLDSLVSNYGETSYAKLSELLLARADLVPGNFKAAETRLSKSFDVNHITSSRPLTGDVFLDELAALLYAKSLYSTPESRSKGKEKLKALVENARLVNVEALLALLRTANGEDETKEAVALATALKGKRSDLATIVDRELNSLGLGAGNQVLEGLPLGTTVLQQ